MIVAGTGHRPNKLGGYKVPNDTYIYVFCRYIQIYLMDVKPEAVVSGMALGFDQWLASIAVKLGIPLIAAIPFEGQESIWNEKDRAIYNRLISKASEVVMVSPGGYSAYKMQVHNEWMVNRCDELLVAYAGGKSGTYNCIEFARSVGKTIHIIPDIKKFII